MAQEITSALYGHFIYAAGNVFSLADQTGTTAAQTMRYPSKWAFAMCYLKSYTPGTDTEGPTFILEGADNSGFTTNVVEMGSQRSGDNSGTNPKSVFLQAFSATGAKAFLRVRIAFQGTGSGTYDVKLGGTS